MCGIAGFLDSRRSAPASTEADVILGNMIAELSHRGPDGEGIWSDAESGVWLAHRRLSIIDLSDEGRQPMVSVGGRYVVTFNGEIYNFKILKVELEKLGHSFRGHSDTEVMLAAFEQWGVRLAVCRFVGMFAFAVWDKATRSLYAGRDRLGKKPLYFSQEGGLFLFGSELKALIRHPAFNAEIDAVSVASMLKYSFVAGCRSIYKTVCKLAPGHLLCVKQATSGGFELNQERYWSAEEVYADGERHRFQGSFESAVDRLEQLLKESVSIRMISDVPFGAFLSGGIDSSAVVALMQAQSSRLVRTFTIGFREDLFDEAAYARQVASHLGTNHTEIYLEASDALNVIPHLPEIFDEPFADASQIPTFLVSWLARRSVTVALSGDGGDELFAGYRRYFRWRQLWGTLRQLPGPARRILSRVILRLPPRFWNTILCPIKRLIEKRAGVAEIGQQVHKAAQVLALGSQDDLYDWLLTVWLTPPVEIAADEIGRSPIVQRAAVSTEAYFNRMSMVDIKGYLTDDILVKVDRASMANSLEVRAPILDHRIVEFAATLPFDYRVDSNGGKRVLREMVYRYVPKRLLDRPKAGFGVPIDEWLRGPLLGWASDLLTAESLKCSGILMPEPIMQKWRAHLSGMESWGAHLWSVLMFQAWYFSRRSSAGGR